MQNKVLLISSNSSGRGGGERYLVYLTRGLRELDCEVHVLLSDIHYMNCWEECIAEEGGRVHRLELKGLSQRPLRFIQACRDKSQIDTISTFCRSIKPSIILVNQQYDEDGLDYIMGALKADVAPVGGVMHMPMTSGKNYRKFGRTRGMILAKWYRDHPYKLIFVSEGAQKEFESYYKFPRPTAVVNNGVPLDYISLNKSTNQFFSDSAPVVGFVGQFVPQKNISCIVQSWLRVRNAGFNCSLLLVGDGPERNEIEKVIRKNAPPESWHITGWTAKPEQLLSEIDIFVLASHFEGLPLSLVEAAGLGIPAVVAPFNGATDVARYAPWVKVANSNSVEEISSLMIKSLININKQKQIYSQDLEKFRNYFSLKRMARDIVEVMGMELDR